MNAARLARLIGPPVAGVALLLLCALAGGLDWLSSAAIGAVTWAGLGLFLYRRDPFQALRRRPGLGIDPRVIATELKTARERIAHIRTAVSRIADRSLAAPLDEIALIAEAIATEVVSDPRDYPRIRRALVYYLEHTSEIAGALAQMPALNTGATPAIARARETLPQIVDTFRSHRDRLAENESFDIDTRLTLLERDLSRGAPGDRAKRNPANRP